MLQTPITEFLAEREFKDRQDILSREIRRRGAVKSESSKE